MGEVENLQLKFSSFPFFLTIFFISFLSFKYFEIYKLNIATIGRRIEWICFFIREI